MLEDLPILYVKPGCQVCEEVSEFLDDHGISYRSVNVAYNLAAFDEMRHKSGKVQIPTLDWHGQILSDFDTDDLIVFLRDHSVKLEDS